jgi:hypothetical protein
MLVTPSAAARCCTRSIIFGSMSIVCRQPLGPMRRAAAML